MTGGLAARVLLALAAVAALVGAGTAGFDAYAWQRAAGLAGFNLGAAFWTTLAGALLGLAAAVLATRAWLWTRGKGAGWGVGAAILGAATLWAGSMLGATAVVFATMECLPLADCGAGPPLPADLASKVAAALWLAPAAGACLIASFLLLVAAAAAAPRHPVSKGSL